MSWVSREDGKANIWFVTALVKGGKGEAGWGWPCSIQLKSSAFQCMKVIFQCSCLWSYIFTFTDGPFKWISKDIMQGGSDTFSGIFEISKSSELEGNSS